MASKITGISIQDFKRVRLVEIQPNANGLTILGGRNAQGKSSCLDAIAYALGGEAFRPSDLKNHEAEKNAAIRVEIDGLIVERAGKNAALKITDARGMHGNQSLLNEIVGRFALDLGTFMRANGTEKAKMLLKMFPELEKELAELKKQDEAIRTARADVNRDIKRLQFQFDDMPQFEGLPAEEISIEMLTQKLAAANAAEMQLRTAESTLNQIEMEIVAEERELTRNNDECAAAEKALEDFENSIELRRAELRQAIEKTVERRAQTQQRKNDLDLKKQEKAAEVETRRADTNGVAAAIQAEISQIGDTNAKIRRNAERRNLYTQISALKAKSDGQTAELDNIERSRKRLLQDTELPLPELSITEEGELLFRGQQWDCMSGAERLKVATAICMKSKPGCGFVLIDGLEAMDQQTLAEFGAWLEELNMQGIGTIVGNTAATVIIEDGRVKDNPPQSTENE